MATTITDLAGKLTDDNGEPIVARQGFALSFPFLISANFSTFLLDNALTAGQEAVVTFALCWAIKTTRGVTIQPHIANTERIVVSYPGYERAARGGAGGAVAQAMPAGVWDGEGDEPPRFEADVTAELFRAVISVTRQTASIGWLLDLAACHQVKPLSAKNVIGYFANNGRVTVNGNSILKVVVYASAVLPRILHTADLADKISVSKWITYHSTFSSTPTLASQAIAAYPSIAEVVLEQSDRDAVAAAAAAIHDEVLARRISDRVIIYTHAYLSAHAKLPESWYQGERAKSTMPGSIYAKFLIGFKRAKDLAVNADAMNAAANLQALANLMK